MLVQENRDGGDGDDGFKEGGKQRRKKGDWRFGLTQQGAETKLTVSTSPKTRILGKQGSEQVPFPCISVERYLSWTWTPTNGAVIFRCCAGFLLSRSATQQLVHSLHLTTPSFRSYEAYF